MHRLLLLVLLPFAPACARVSLLRDVEANLGLAYAPQSRDVRLGVSLIGRPSAPPLPVRDQTLDEPTAFASRLDDCRSRFDLCRFEQASIAHALAALGVAP